MTILRSARGMFSISLMLEPAHRKQFTSIPQREKALFSSSLSPAKSLGNMESPSMFTVLPASFLPFLANFSSRVRQALM